MANLPSNSFLKPVETQQVSPYQQVDVRALGGLRPLVNDLIQTNAPKNKFLAETYSADPNAIQSRLGEYEAYDPTKLEGLASYLSPLAFASHQGAQYFKKGTVDQALSGLTGLDTAASSEWSPLLSGLNSVGSFGGQSMYEIDKLKEHMKGLSNAYSPLDAAEAQSLFQRAGKSLDPTGSLYGKQFYDKSKLGEVYDALPDAGVDIGGVKSLGGWLGAKYDPNFQDPRAMEAGKTYYGDPWGYSHEVQRVKGTPYYFIPESNFQPTRSGTALTWYSPASSEGLYDYTYNGQRGLAFDPTKTSLNWSSGRNNDLYAEKKGGGLLGSLNEVIQKIDPLNFIVEKGVANLLGYDSGLDMIRSIGEPIGNLAGAVFSGGIPWGSIVMGLDNISTGNDKALLGNVIGGLTSYAGAKMPTGSVLGTGYSLGSAATNTAANQAIINALSTAARGGDTSNILTSALISGLGAYGSGALGGAMKGASPLAKMAANTGYGTAVGGLSSALQGKGFSQGATNAARRGVTNAAINAALNSQLYKGLV